MFARSKEAGRRRPNVVIAHSDPAYAAGAARAFRRYGWEVVAAADGPEARRLAAAPAVRLVVLETELPDESGWLTSAKLTAIGFRAPVVLVGDEGGAAEDAFAAFAGAVRLITRRQGYEALLEEAGLTVPVTQVV
ncbi:MAG TPA: response regulator [Gemmataceae bacterium]|nr:response regulator [Gemmataceae bacterium]